MTKRTTLRRAAVKAALVVAGAIVSLTGAQTAEAAGAGTVDFTGSGGPVRADPAGHARHHDAGADHLRPDDQPGLGPHLVPPGRRRPS